MKSTWRAEWEAALDELELSVDLAERLLRGEDTTPRRPWTPPVVQGPLPSELLPRAHELLQRQHAAMTRSTAAVASTRRQLELTRRISETSRHEPPVYLDINA